MFLRSLLKYFVVIGIVIYLVIFTINGCKESNRILAERLPSTYLMSPEDSALFSKTYLSRISVSQIKQSKNRHPLAFLKVDKQYLLIFHSIDLNQDLPLKSFLEVNIQNVHQSNNVTYTVVPGSDHDFLYRTDALLPVSHVYLTISDPPKQETVSNDSVISYHLFCRDLSFSYAKDLPIDLFMAGRELPFGNYEKVSVQLLIWKRKTKLYLFFLKARKGDSLPSGMLYDLVNVNK